MNTLTLKRIVFHSFFMMALMISSCKPTPTSTTVGNRYDSILPINGIDRTFIVQRPSSYDPLTEYPVVFVFHGSGQDAERAYDVWGWKELGDSENIITVYPQSLEYEVTEDSGAVVTKTKWNDGFLETIVTPGQTLENDVEFTSLMLAYLRLNFSIDEEAIFVTGFSNGGNFTWRLAMELADQFDGYAPFAGKLQLASPSPSTLGSIYTGIGNEDPFFTILNGGLTVPMDEASLTTVMQPIHDEVLPILELADSPDVLEDTPELLILQWDDHTGTAINTYSFALVEGALHTYPSNLNTNTSLNPNSIHVAELFWEFFENLP